MIIDPEAVNSINLGSKNGGGRGEGSQRMVPDIAKREGRRKGRQEEGEEGWSAGLRLK